MTNPETRALRAVLTVTVETRPDGGHYFDQADFTAHAVQWVRSALRGQHAVDQVTVVDQAAELARAQAEAHQYRTALQGVARKAAVSVPPPATRADDRAALRDRIAAAIWERQNPGRRYADCEYRWQADAEADADAVLAVLPEPADRAAVLREAAEGLGRMDYDTDSHDYGYDTYRDAWNGGVMDGADLLRRLADEAAVVPPPALTEEGRLRAQVEVLQQDVECDRGLVKVGARCMREGHQGLIEGGRLVLEGWRFALSTALDLGTGAPWEAIHERAKELAAAEAPHTETPDALPGGGYEATTGHAITCGAGFGMGCDCGASPTEPETVHACPPDGSGLTPCCGRTPFELPRTDRISSEAAAVTCAPDVVAQPGKET